MYEGDAMEHAEIICEYGNRRCSVCVCVATGIKISFQLSYFLECTDYFDVEIVQHVKQHHVEFGPYPDPQSA